MADLPDWAESERGDIIGCYTTDGSWIHEEEGQWYDSGGNLHDPPSEVELNLSDTISVVYTGSDGDIKYATFHGGIDDYWDLDDAIAQLDDHDSGTPA